MTDTVVSYKSGSTLSLASFIVTIVGLVCAVTLLIIKLTDLDLLTQRIMWWVAFAVMVVGLILNMMSSKRAGRNRKFVLIGSFIGLATAIILIIALFVR